MNPFKYGCTVGGEYFCRRPELEQKLRNHILSGQNVVIQGERRMGKTSLVLETVRTTKGVSLFHADLLCVRDTADLCRRLAAALARQEKTAGFLEKVLSALTRLRPTLTIDQMTGCPTISVDAACASDISSLEAVMDAILSQTAKRRTCIVLDEFQDILDMEDGDRLLALLRSRIQLDANTAYIFLGSVRNRMTDIFWNPDSPFYHSAAALPVGEIVESDFLPFLQKRFATGKRKLTPERYAEIAALARHTPGYIQELCDTLWEETAPGQTICKEDVQHALLDIFSREQDHYEIFIRRLTPLQMRVLRTLAIRGEDGVYSSASLATAKVYNSASMKRAVEKLVKDGLVYIYQGHHRFVNPFFREWVKRI